MAAGTSLPSEGTILIGSEQISYTGLAVINSENVFTGCTRGVNGTTAAITGILVDTSGQLATTDADVDKLEGLVTFADPVTFTDAITEVTMSFNVGSGMSLYLSGGTSLGMGSGPFQAIITTN